MAGHRLVQRQRLEHVEGPRLQGVGVDPVRAGAACRRAAPGRSGRPCTSARCPWERARRRRAGGAGGRRERGASRRCRLATHHAGLHPLLRRVVGDDAPVEEDIAGFRRQQAGDQADECGLARAVRPDDGMALAPARAKFRQSKTTRPPKAMCRSRVSSDHVAGAGIRSLRRRKRCRSTSSDGRTTPEERDDKHQQQADPEIPVDRADRRKPVAQNKKHESADKGAVEPRRCRQ